MSAGDLSAAMGKPHCHEIDTPISYTFFTIYVPFAKRDQGTSPCPPLPLDQQFHIRAQRFTECAHGVADLLAVEHPLHVQRPENPAAASGDGPIKNRAHVLRNDDPTGCERERTSRCH